MEDNELLSDLLVTKLLYYSAASYCPGRGMWDARRLPEVFRAGTDPRSKGFGVGSLGRVVVYVVAAAGVIAGLHWMRWLLILNLAWLAWRLSRECATGVAEGRKAASLASSIESVRGQAKPAAMDYALGVVVMSPFALLPLLALIVMAPIASAAGGPA